jgi:hypothetical protein
MGPHTQGVALGWHVARRWRSNPAAVKTSITCPSVVMARAKCEGRSAKSEVRSPKSEVRSSVSSTFQIRHSTFAPVLGEFDQLFDDLHRREGAVEGQRPVTIPAQGNAPGTIVEIARSAPKGRDIPA